MNTLNKTQLGTLTKLGVALADSFVQADNKASETKKELFVSLASKYYDKAKYSIVLDSYKAELIKLGMSTNSANVRASEALQVIKAANITEVSNDNLNSLREFKGGYNAFIAYARELVSKASAKAGEVKTTKDTKAPVKLTDTQVEKTSDNVEKANVIQLQDFINKAVKQVSVKAESAIIAGKAQYSVISNICNNMLDSDKIDEALKEGAKSILAIAESMILRIEQAEQATQQVIEQTAVEQAA